MRRIALLACVTLPVVFLPAAAGAAAARSTVASNPFCGRLGHSIQASSGAQMYCFGSQPNGGQGPQPMAIRTTTPFAPNVDAANPREDITPSGLQAYGQSEVSVAATGPYVLEAWNDSTGFFAPCPSPQNKEELTGYGFSADGGASFTDEGGLPNTKCNTDVLFGDPSVEGWTVGGATYFYASSLYDSPKFNGLSFLAINACKATGTGTAASIHCGQPIKAAQSTQCAQFGHLHFCNFLDKEFLAIDPRRGRLYMSYTEFGVDPSSSLFNGQIELAVCDIGPPSGGVGPAGGTALHPVCEPDKQATPYLIVAPGDPSCEKEGAYPAVDLVSGDVYVAFEFNWATNVFGPTSCLGTKTRDIVQRVPVSCLTLTPTSGCGPSNTGSVFVRSLDAAFVPGYNRFPMNDFPRIAADPMKGTVTLVWNDARRDAVGDIFLESFALGTLARIQSAPVRINPDTGGWHFLPALRQADATGDLNITFYQRDSGDTAVTNVEGVLGIDPLLTAPPVSSVLVTTQSSDWNADSSDIFPNFGDYTDNYVIATTAPPFTGNQLYVAWSDGRLGFPQPFEANGPTP